MKEQYRFIFDMDGTLYHFDKEQGQTFTASRFYSDLRNNVYSFFMERRGLSRDRVIAEYERIKEKYNGEISLGVEKEYDIDRYEYFSNIWNLNPSDYIEKDPDLPKVLNQLKGRIALLTAAPNVWTVNVLAYLNIQDAFGGKIYTGEPNIRKPSSLIFQKIADDFGSLPNNTFSIGDQEYSDILPAKSIGMKTILIGSNENTTADYQTKNVKSAIIILKKEGFI